MRSQQHLPTFHAYKYHTKNSSSQYRKYRDHFSNHQNASTSGDEESSCFTEHCNIMGQKIATNITPDDTARGGLNKLKYCWLCKLSLTAKLSFSQKLPYYISSQEMASPTIAWTVFFLWYRDSTASTNLSNYSTQKLLLLLGFLLSDHCQSQHPSCNAASQANSQND